MALEQILGDKIIKTPGGDAVSLASVLSNKKQIILYFSAHWCAPCQEFTPRLSEAYDTYKKKVGDDQMETELVFVSQDFDEEEFTNYHKGMSFPALPYNKELGKLMDQFEVEGIPHMVAINENGDVVQEDADFRGLVDTYGADAFPLTPEKVEELNALQEAKSKDALKKLYNGEIPFTATAKDGSTKSLKDLLTDFEYIGLLLGDGDFNDDANQAANDDFKKVNSEMANRCAIVYVGWELLDEQADHSKTAEIFDFLVAEVSEDLREALGCVLGKGTMFAPQIVLIRKGTGLCSIDGKCEEDDVPVLVSCDPGFAKIQTFGPSAFPWDDAAMAAAEEKEKAEVEKLRSRMKDFQFLTEPETDGEVVIQKGEKSLKERLFVGDGEGVVGIYFSAHWCPPCQMFTPKLVQCYGELKAAGKKFEVVFVSGDMAKDEFEEYYETMVTDSGDQFLALDFEQRDLNKRLNEVFQVGGIPTLVLLKPDGSILSMDGVSSISVVGASAFPWDEDTLEIARREKHAAAVQKEKENEEAQVSAGAPVVKRLIGTPESIDHNVTEKKLSFDDFSTAGVPSLFADSGVIYYELEILGGDGIPQFGFALKDGLELSDEETGEGVGDNEKSWGIDGVRGLKWHGESTETSCSWFGDATIGLAVNVDKGIMAVSKDGNWAEEGYGIIFNDDAIKQGVYPCLTAQRYEVKYCFGDSGFKYAPPSDEFWDKAV